MMVSSSLLFEAVGKFFSVPHCAIAYFCHNNKGKDPLITLKDYHARRENEVCGNCPRGCLQEGIATLENCPLFFSRKEGQPTA